ncbi:short chain type dehydrogenase [Fusarium albosuccineum]|uniref:Short chain type dehydrogenase n=1 Tax=Fusarium albosuccineum TaxID=1237068 RepID=A0A8H4L7R9_9HYPO|nr:short chain type dehydrogenase [Fusarium albosuccineum]
MSSHAVYPDLSGKIALVLGIGQTTASSSTQWGNGAAIAYRLSQNNAIIFGCDINLESANNTKSRLPGPCEVMVADVTSSDDVARVVKSCLDKHGRIDILVNNVGMPISGDAVSLPETAWDQQINLNLKSVYLSCHFVLPIMEKQGSGVVVNNASIAGIRYLGKPQVAYNSAKAAVIHFTQVTAATFAGKGIRLNCVVPGLMLTPLVERMGLSDDPAERKMFEKITQNNVPMGCMGSAFDVANAVSFLASDSAKYITGQSLVIDGGLTVSTGT